LLRSALRCGKDAEMKCGLYPNQAAWDVRRFVAGLR
jgi:hypothetical protein